MRSVALLLAAAALAGCLAPEAAPSALGPDDLDERLSRPIFDVLPPVQLRVPSYDGVEIDNWVFLPDAPPGTTFPALVNFSPYWSNAAPAAESGGDAFSRYLVDHFVPRGYAVVLSSARGTGLSDGCFTIGGPGELRDMQAVVDRLAEEPWSSGLFGTGGKSYDGTMSQGLAVTGHPAVRAHFPVSPISEFYKYNYVNGVPYRGQGQFFNTYYVAGVGWGVDPFDPASSSRESLRIGDLACEDNADVQRAQYESFATGDYTPYWQARNYSAMAAEVPAGTGIFYVHGLEDWNVKPDHMTPWLDVLPGSVFVRTWLGQWGHDYPHRDDLNATLLRFFDHFLKGVDTGLLDEPPVQVQSDDGVWRNAEDWPPPGATPTALYLAEGGLAFEPGSGSARFVDSGLPTRLEPGLVYASEPLEEPMRYAGAPDVSLRLSTTATHGTIAVTLYEVVGETWTVVNQGFLDLRHRESLERSTPTQPGTTYTVRFGMYPQDDVLDAGARVALRVHASSPEGAPVVVAPVPSRGVITVEHGEDSRIVLPVVRLDGAEARQPEDVGCWLC